MKYFSVLLAVSMTVFSTAHAEPFVTFYFEAVVDEVTGISSPDSERLVQVGDIMRGSYTFDAAVIDSQYTRDDIGQYSFYDSFEFTATLGELSLISSDSSYATIVVSDNYSSYPYTRDEYRVSLLEEAIPSCDYGSFSFYLELYSFIYLGGNDVFNSDALPLAPPDLTLFEAENRIILEYECLISLPEPQHHDINITLTSTYLSLDPPILPPDMVISNIVTDIINLNLSSGIENSLDNKLDTALQALDDVNQNNDVAAVNSLQAFINAVQAQTGTKIDAADAERLIAAAQQLIDRLTNN